MQAISVRILGGRDCSCELQCEFCGHRETDDRAYNDHYFWQNVIPQRKCVQCGKASR